MQIDLGRWLTALGAGVALTAAASPASQADVVVTGERDRAMLIVPGYQHGATHIPPSAAPDDQGAFRFICGAGKIAAVDPLVYPGEVGGRVHLHQFFGNDAVAPTSTHETLRTTGGSSCGNRLNRSGYWIPALFNARGQVISLDYASIYYKRNSDASGCGVAARGCADIPAGLRAVQGYDMARRQGPTGPFSVWWRCMSNQVRRDTIPQALADCGGAGQVMGTVTFGMCWDGRLDSPDHRAHLAYAAYNNQGQIRCPASHARLIPTLTQQVAYTITRDDGEVYLSSDRMAGMKPLPGGTSFHADYMEAWDPKTRETWSRRCIGQLLNCSDGELGDGTMMKRGALLYTAEPRLLAAPRQP